jgi:hypothetical protein
MRMAFMVLVHCVSPQVCLFVGSGVGWCCALTSVVSVVCLPQMLHFHVCVMFHRGRVLLALEHCVPQ